MMAAPGTPSNGTRVYVSGIGQTDNIGDSLLRRAYLDALRSLGELHVLVGAESDSYARGLGIGDGDVRYADRSEWWRSAWCAASRARVVIAYNAGEMELRPFYVRSYAKYAAVVLRARRRGGFAVHIGMGIRSRSAWIARVIGVLLRPVRLVLWRDTESAKWTGVGATAPDWGFALGTADAKDISLSETRTRVAISMRTDRGVISDTWLAAVSAYCKQHALRPVVVEQVRSDRQSCIELADLLEAECLLWDEDCDNLQQEERLREIYRESAAVISNRLHVLIAAVTEGATPIGLTVSDPQKLLRTFTAAGLPNMAFAVDRADCVESVLKRMNSITDSRPDLIRGAITARARLAALPLSSPESDV